MSNERERLIELQKSQWKSLEKLCTSLSLDEWGADTDCPTWTVKDCIAHLVGIEHRILGREVLDIPLSKMSHIKNEQGAKNELDVVSRRAMTPAELLGEFAEVNSERLKELNGQLDFSAEADSPIGKGNVADQVSVRVFDCWVHEQDIRRAIQKPGNLSGLTAQHSYERMNNAMPFVFGKKVGGPEGSSVRFKIYGESSFILNIKIQEGRARLVTDLPEPTIYLEMDCETFMCLSCGRWDPDKVLTDHKVSIQGDQNFGVSIVKNMNYMV